MGRLYFKTEEVITRQKQGYVDFVDEYTQVYDNVLSLTTKLKTLLDIQILLFISKESNSSNIFNANQLLIDRIQKEIKKTFTKQTFYTCMNNLVDAKLIIKMTRGQYQLNPMALWRNSQNDRTKMLEEIIQNKDTAAKYVITSEKEESSVEEQPLNYYLNN